MKFAASFVTLAIAFTPFQAFSQEDPEGSPTEIVQQELVKFFTDKGYADTRLKSVVGDEGQITVEGLAGTKSGGDFSIGKIEIKEIDGGYRWTKAKEIIFSDVSFSFAGQTLRAGKVLGNGFGVLDIDSARPGFAFDELVLVDGEWLRDGQSLFKIETMTAAGKHWKEMYSVPGTLDVRANVSFSGALLGPVGAYLPSLASQVHKAEVTATLNSVTSAGRLSTIVDVKTDKLGNHHLDATLLSVDEPLMAAYFEQGEENTLGDKEKLQKLEKELASQLGDIAVRPLLYRAENMEFLSAAMAQSGLTLDNLTPFVQGWVTYLSSPEKASLHQREISAPILKFLGKPKTLELEIIPARDVNWQTFKNNTTDKTLDLLGARVSAQ